MSDKIKCDNCLMELELVEQFKDIEFTDNEKVEFGKFYEKHVGTLLVGIMRYEDIENSWIRGYRAGIKKT